MAEILEKIRSLRDIKNLTIRPFIATVYRTAKTRSRSSVVDISKNFDRQVSEISSVSVDIGRLILSDFVVVRARVKALTPALFPHADGFVVPYRVPRTVASASRA